MKKPSYTPMALSHQHATIELFYMKIISVLRPSLPKLMWCDAFVARKASCRFKAVHLASFLNVHYKIVKDSGIQTGRSMWMCLMFLDIMATRCMLEITYPVFIVIVCIARKLHISRYVHVTLLKFNTRVGVSVCISFTKVDTVYVLINN